MDGKTEKLDVTIAQELLNTDSILIPKRKMSFGQSAISQAPAEKDEVGRCQETTGLKKRRSRYDATSNTWTSSEGDQSDYGENEDRTPFVEEYNRLAKKYGIAAMIPDEFVPVNFERVTIFAKPGSWIMRKLLKRTNSINMTKRKAEMPSLRHRRSISDLTLRLKPKNDALKDKSLEELVRLCGASALYLPSEYAAGTLAVPTCFRATAQYLVQHASTRGIFRIPGAHSTVMALYNHYASEDENGDVISGTVRCPTLPEHIKCDVHDVASAFKKFLAGLPGGILGKSWLFEAFLVIHDQLQADPEWTRTKQSRLRARLIALAIASAVPRYQRELICAVFGLLSMIGRAAETARREDEQGRPLPTSDLMGYVSLGIVFGPLLIGEMLDAHNLSAGSLNGTLHLAQKNSPKSLIGRGKKNRKSAEEATTLMRESTERVRVASKITEMLITHWRDIVRHMKNLGALKSSRNYQSLATKTSKPFLRPSASASFMIRKPPLWDIEGSAVRRGDHSMSPSPIPRYGQASSSNAPENRELLPQDDTLSVRKQRSRPRLMSSQILSCSRSMSILAPTVEENQTEEEHEKPTADTVAHHHSSNRRSNQPNDTGESQSTQTYRPVHSRFTCKPDFAPRKTGQTNSCASVPEASPYGYNAESFVTQSPQIIQALSNANFTVSPANSKATPEIQLGPAPDPSALCSPATPTKPQKSSSGNNIASDFNEVILRPFPVEERTLGLHTPRMRLKFQTERNTQRRIPSPVPSKFLSATQFPKGLVSNRVRGIAASDPGAPPSGFRALLESPKGSRKRPSWKRDLGTRNSNLFFRNIQRDPLSRVSQEEDMASLAALAEVIDSQEERGSSFRLNPATSEVGESHSDIERLHLPRRGVSSQLERSEECQDETCSKKQALVNDVIVFPAVEAFGLITPRNRRTIVSTQSGGSVKALAAKFNSGKMMALPALSLIKASGHHLGTRSMFEHDAISRYTLNTPSQTRSSRRSTRSSNSDTTMRFVRKPLPSNGMSDSAPVVQLPKQSGSAQDSILNLDTDGARDTTSHRFPRLSYFPQPTKNDARIAVRWRGNGSPTLPPPRPQKHYDETTVIHKRPSLGRVLPRPDEPLVDQYMNFARPSSLATTVTQDHSLSPFDSFYAEPLFPAACTQGSFEVGLRRGTSLLYSQVQHLQRQLHAKSDEAEQLRRHLVTKDSFRDLGTLSEELRHTKRDLTAWKKRAEIAEKRLTMLAVLDPMGDTRVTIAGELLTAATYQDKGDVLTPAPSTNMEDKLFEVRNYHSNETIRRPRSYSPTFFGYGSSEFDGLREIRQAYEKGVYEME